MKYLRFFEDIRTETWNAAIDKTISKLSVHDLIYDKRVPHYYDSISDKDMLSEYGTSDKNLHYFIQSLKHNRSLWENFIWNYSTIFYGQIKKIIIDKISILENDLFMSEILDSYLGKMGTFEDIAERIINNAPIYKEKETQLYEKVEKSIKEFLLDKINNAPEIYTKNSEYFDAYMKYDIPDWIKDTKKFNL